MTRPGHARRLAQPPVKYSVSPCCNCFKVTEGQVEPSVARKTAARPAVSDAAEGHDRAPLDTEWPKQLYQVLKSAQVRQVSYVPDAGHSALIRLFAADREVASNVLTTEEEGIAIATGAWLGGSRSVLLLQSSGVGNCVNMLSLVTMTRTPVLVRVTVRGQWAG